MWSRFVCQSLRLWTSTWSCRESSPPQATYKPAKNLARDILKIVIRDNTFRFHDSFYNQVKGVAMGTRCAPPFPNIFLGSLEEKALTAWTGTHPLLRLRFLDDILMLWNGHGPELTNFQRHLNDQMSAIKFTMSKSHENITWRFIRVTDSTPAESKTSSPSRRLPTFNYFSIMTLATPAQLSPPS